MKDFDKRFSDEMYCEWLEQELWKRLDAFIDGPLRDVWEDYISDLELERWRIALKNAYTSNAVLAGAEHENKSHNR